MEAETALVQPQVKKCQEPPAAGKGKEGFLPEVLLEGPAHTLISDFWPLELGESTSLLF